MAFALSRLKSLFVKRETQFSTDAFGTSPTAAYRLEAEDITWEPEQEFVPRTAQTQRLGPVAGLIGRKGGKVKFKVKLRSLGTANDDNAGADATIGGALLECLYGAGLVRVQQRGQAADADQSGQAANTIKLSSQGKFGGATGAPLLAIKKGGYLEARLIPAVETNAVQTVRPAWASAPANSQVVYGADCWRPRYDASDIIGASAPGTVTFVGFGNGFVYVFTGCMAAPPKIMGGAGKAVTMEFEFQVDNWTDDSGYALAGEQLNNVQSAILGTNTPMLVGYDTETPTDEIAATPIAEFEIDFGVTIQEIPSVLGAQGRAGWMPTEYKPTLKVKPFYASSWRTAYANRTVQQVLLQIGRTEGHAVVLALPYAQIQKFPGEADSNGAVTNDVEFVGLRDTDTGVLEPAWLGFY